jgi:hypothetical protein
MGWPNIYNRGADIAFEDEAGIGIMTRSGETWGEVNSPLRGVSAISGEAILNLHRVWSLGDLDEIVGTDPFLESRLHVLGLELQVILGGTSRLIEWQIEIHQRDKFLRDTIDTRFG